jgi:hypothetical protein
VNPSIIGYGVASTLPLFPGDGISAIVIAATGFGIASPITIDAWGALALEKLDSRMRVDDSINLMRGRFRSSRHGDVVGTFFVGGVLGAADERCIIRA